MANSPGKAELVYKTIQEDILNGGYRPGERLVESGLTERLGVSKTPVREALARLKQDGLIGGKLYQGMYVIRLVRKDIIEIYDLRAALEGLAARKTAELVTPEKAEKLSSLIRLSEEYVKKNIKEYISLDLEFHNLLKVFSENQRLSEMMQRLYFQNRTLLKTSLNLPKRGPKISLNEHKKIVSAILAQNPHRAEKMAKEHVRNTREAVLDWFDRTQHG